MLDFQIPRITSESVEQNRGTFTIEPLDRGFGYTFGNSLRRVLLSSLAGAAVTSVRIEGVGGLADYAAVERLLQSIPGVRRADVAEVDAGSVTFEVDMRGGSAALEHELSGSTRMLRGTSAGASLVYRYQPQG